MNEDLRQHLDGNAGDDALLEAIGRLPDGKADVDVEAALANVKARRFQEPQRSAWSIHLLRAAVIVGLLLGGTFVWHSTMGPEKSQVVASAKTFVTKTGQTDTVALQDGSNVILGPDSRLTIAAEYGKNARSVELEGMATFSVKHDASREFTVKTEGGVIRDLGTVFVVRTSGAQFSVSVTEGSVSVAGKELKAGDKAVVFDDATLNDVALELRRSYGIELKVADTALVKRHITGSFTGDSAEQVLNVISLVLGARVERNGNTATLHSR